MSWLNIKRVACKRKFRFPMFTLRLLGEAKMTGRLVYLLMPIHSFCPAGFIAPHCVMFLNVYAMLCEGGSRGWFLACGWMVLSVSHPQSAKPALSFFFFLTWLAVQDFASFDHWFSAATVSLKCKRVDGGVSFSAQAVWIKERIQLLCFCTMK